MVTIPGCLFHYTRIPVSLLLLAISENDDPERGCRYRRQQSLFIIAGKIGTLIGLTSLSFSNN